MHGKIAVVTGAAGGIGAALVEKLLEKGAIVHAWDISPFTMKGQAENAEKYGRHLVTRKVDVTKIEEIRDGLDAITSDKKQVHYWFNNAGISGLGDFLKGSLDNFQKVMDINFMGVVFGTRIALEHMEHVGAGSIINVASVAGHLPGAYLSAYCASKHAVVGFTRSLREEMRLKSSDVKLVLVSPGFVETPMIEKGTEHGFPEWLTWMLASPASVANAVMRGLEKEKDEIFPTLNGKLMMQAQRFLPNISSTGGKILLARSFRDYLLNRYEAR